MQFHGVFGSTATEVSREQIDWVESKRRELLSCLILLPLINVSLSALNIHYISPWICLLQTHCNMHAVYFKHVVICTPSLHNLESLLNVSNSCCLKNNINIINIFFIDIYIRYILPPAIIIQQNRSTYYIDCVAFSPT